jgi:hypothetical protein
MNASRPLIGAAATLVALSATAASPHSEAEAPITAVNREALSLARAHVRLLEGRLDAAQLHKAKVCAAAAAADEALMSTEKLSSKELQEQAQAALDRNKECGDQGQRANAANVALAAARDRLRALFSEVAKCASGTEPSRCAALPSVASVVAAEQSMAGETASIAAQVALVDVKALVEKASQAQDRVATAKKQSASSFTIADTAAKTALENVVQGSTAATTPAARAIRSGEEARAAVSAAQRASNRLVEQSLRLSGCAAADVRCAKERTDSVYIAAVAAQELERNLAVAAASTSAMRTAGYEAAVFGDDSDPATRQRAVRFLEMLDKYTDAKALFSDEAATITAGSDGTNATLKFSLRRTGLTSLRNSSLTFSTPASKGRETLVGDRLAGANTLTLGHTLGRFFDSSKKDRWFLSVFGLDASYGYKTFDYLDKGTLDDGTRREYPWSMSVQWAFVRAKSGDPFVQVVKIGRSRSFADADSGTLCKAAAVATDPLECKTGALGTPTKSYANNISYELRAKVGAYAVSPRVTLEDDGTKRQKALFLPIYMIGNSDADKGGLTGGIRLDWQSGKGFGAGIFVSTPFSLFTPN